MKSIVLFDVDGTLTEPRLKINDSMVHFINLLKDKITVGIVGGSDIAKQKEQLGEDFLNELDYVFSENGLDFYKKGFNCL